MIDQQNRKTDARQLFLLGLLTLFLELVLIRYLAGNIWNMGYFPNLVLIAAFLGLGSGFIYHHYVSRSRSSGLFCLSALLLFILLALICMLNPAVPGFQPGHGEVGGELFYTNAPTQSGWQHYLLFAFWFIMVFAIFALIAQRTAKLFRLFKPLTAYTLDIAGSIAGILAFMLISWLHLAPYLWFIFLALLFVATTEPGKKRLAIAVFVLLLGSSLMASYQDQTHIGTDQPLTFRKLSWSPYQRVEYMETAAPQKKLLYVNGIAHQTIYSEKYVKDSFYQAAFYYRQKRGLPAFENILVIGSGVGNDVLAALQNDAKHVDAVEIDPVIAAIGKEYNAAAPYQSPKVNLVIHDARAFMHQTDKQYDLILFAFTDSLIKASAIGQLRLENYVYTVEAIRKAYSLLRAGGEILFYNVYRYEWLMEKLKAMIAQGTGREPMILWQVRDFWGLLVGKDLGQPAPKGTDQDIDLATDDWPFLYLQKRNIPGLYGKGMLFMLALLAGMLLLLRIRKPGEDPLHRIKSHLATKIGFAVMGVAFLLLETKSVIQFSLLFGTTWWNNSLVFLAVLTLVLAANWTAMLLPGNRRTFLLIGLLVILSCLSVFFYPLANLLGVESVLWRYVYASLLTFLPIYFANLLFSFTFREQAVAEHLFGWNLIGATLGGTIEYSSMLVGYNGLGLLVTACYVIVVICFLRERIEKPAAASAA